MYRSWPFIFICLLYLSFSGVVQSGIIQGTATEAETGTAISDLRIRIYNSDWEFQFSDSAWTGEDGSYASGELEPGNYYVKAVSIYPQPWISQYWFQTGDKNTALPIQISDDEPIIGIDFSMEQGGYILGTIKDESNHPLVDLDVDLYTSDWKYSKIYTDRTDGNGQYILGPLPPEHWFVRADPDLIHGVCQEFWPDAWYRDQAQFLVVESGGEIPGVDFILSPGGTISGQVIEQRNQEVKSGYEMIVYSPEGIEQPVHHIKTDDLGHYSVFGLPDGGYKIKANAPWGCGVRDTYFPDSEDMANASTIMLSTSAHVDDINFSLPEGNFDLNIKLKMPRRWVDPGELFGLNISIINDGPDLENLPVFLILDIQGALYFWPSWSLWNSKQQTGLDYDLTTISAGNSSITILPEFIWPKLGYDMDNLQFIGAITNWSMSDLASDLEVEEWSFDGQ